MYSPVHATVGLLLAQAIPNPVLGLTAAVASHYLLDAIPHGDSGFGAWMTSPGARHRIVIVETIDLGSAAVMTWWLVAIHPERSAWYLAAGALASILPDLLWGLRYVLDQLRWRIPVISWLVHHHDRWHSWGHAKTNYDLPLIGGLVYQGVFLAAVLLLRL